MARINFDEYEKASPEEQEKMFRRADADPDDVVEMEERRQAKQAKRAKSEAPAPKQAVTKPAAMGEGLLTPEVKSELRDYFENPANARYTSGQSTLVRKGMDDYFNNPMNARPSSAPEGTTFSYMGHGSPYNPAPYADHNNWGKGYVPATAPAATAPAATAPAATAPKPVAAGADEFIPDVDRSAGEAAAEKYLAKNAEKAATAAAAAKAVSPAMAARVAYGKGLAKRGMRELAFDLANRYIPRMDNDTTLGRATNMARDAGETLVHDLGVAQIPAGLMAATGIGAAAAPLVEAGGAAFGLGHGAYNVYKNYKAGKYGNSPEVQKQVAAVLSKDPTVNPTVPMPTRDEIAGNFTRHANGQIEETLRDSNGNYTGQMVNGTQNGENTRTIYDAAGNAIGYGSGGPSMQQDYDYAKADDQRRAQLEMAMNALHDRALNERAMADAAQRDRANDMFSASGASNSLRQIVNAGSAISQDPVRNAAKAQAIADAAIESANATGADPMDVLKRALPQGSARYTNPNYAAAMEVLRAHGNGTEVDPGDRLSMVSAMTPRQFGNARQADAAKFANATADTMNKSGAQRIKEENLDLSRARLAGQQQSDLLKAERDNYKQAFTEFQTGRKELAALLAQQSKATLPTEQAKFDEPIKAAQLRVAAAEKRFDQLGGSVGTSEANQQTEGQQPTQATAPAKVPSQAAIARLQQSQKDPQSAAREAELFDKTFGAGAHKKYLG